MKQTENAKAAKIAATADVPAEAATTATASAAETAATPATASPASSAASATAAATAATAATADETAASGKTAATVPGKNTEQAAPANQTAATSPAKPSAYVKYLVHRETHSSRAITAVIVALLVIAAMAYLITEAVLSLTGHAPLLMKPHAMVDHLVAIGADYQRFIPASIIAAGVIIALVGLWLLLKAIAPGPLRRHAIRDQRMAIVVDDAVIAAGVSRSLRRHLRLDIGQVTTSISQKHVTAHITPTSGIPVSDSEVTYHVQQLMQTWQVEPRPKVAADINSQGVVGR